MTGKSTYLFSQSTILLPQLLPKNWMSYWTFSSFSSSLTSYPFYFYCVSFSETILNAKFIYGNIADFISQGHNLYIYYIQLGIIHQQIKTQNTYNTMSR
jgi:hypothetical protein